MSSYELKVRLKQPNSERKPLSDIKTTPAREQINLQNSTPKLTGNEQRQPERAKSSPAKDLPTLYLTAQVSRQTIAINAPSLSQSALQQQLQSMIRSSLDPPSTLRVLSKLTTSLQSEITAAPGSSTPKKPMHLYPSASKKTGVPSLGLPTLDSPPSSPKGGVSGMVPSKAQQPTPNTQTGAPGNSQVQLQPQNNLYLPFAAVDMFLFELFHRFFNVVYQGGDCDWGSVVKSILQGLIDEPDVPSWKDTNPHIIPAETTGLSRFEGVFDVVMARQMRRVSLESDFNELLYSVGIVASWTWFLITGRLIIICNDHPQRCEMEHILSKMIKSLKIETGEDFITVKNLRLENLESAFEQKSRHSERYIYLIIDDKLKRGTFKSPKLFPSCPVVFLDSKKYTSSYHGLVFFDRCVKLVLLQHENDDMRVSINKQVYWIGGSKLENVHPKTKGFSVEMQFLLSKIMTIQLDRINNDSAPATITHYSLNVKKDNYLELKSQVSQTIHLFAQQGLKDCLIWVVPPSEISIVIDTIKYYKSRYLFMEDIELLIVRSLDPKDNVCQKIKGDGQYSTGNSLTQKILVCQLKYDVLPQFIIHFEPDLCLIWNTQTSKETTFQPFVREYIRTIMKRKDSATVAINQENIQASLRNVRVNIRAIKSAGPIKKPKFLNRHISSLEGPIRYDGPIQIWHQKLDFKSLADQKTELLVKEDEVSVFMESNEDSLDQLNQTVRRKETDSEEESSTEKSPYLGVTDSENSSGEPSTTEKTIKRAPKNMKESKKSAPPTSSGLLKVCSLRSIVVFQPTPPQLSRHFTLIQGLNLANLRGKSTSSQFGRSEVSPERETRTTVYAADPRNQIELPFSSPRNNLIRRYSGAKQSQSKRGAGEMSPISSPQKAFSPMTNSPEVTLPEPLASPGITKQELVQQPEPQPVVPFTKAETPAYMPPTSNGIPGVSESKQMISQPDADLAHTGYPIASHQVPSYAGFPNTNSLHRHAENAGMSMSHTQTPPRLYSPQPEGYTYQSYSPSEPAYAFEEYHQQTTTTGMMYSSTTLMQSVASQGLRSQTVNLAAGQQARQPADQRENSHLPQTKSEALPHSPQQAPGVAIRQAAGPYSTNSTHQGYHPQNSSQPTALGLPKGSVYTEPPVPTTTAITYQPQTLYAPQALPDQPKPSHNRPPGASHSDGHTHGYSSASQQHPASRLSTADPRSLEHLQQPVKASQPGQPTSHNNTSSTFNSHSNNNTSSHNHNHNNNNTSSYNHNNKQEEEGRTVESRVFTRKVHRPVPVAAASAAAKSLFLGKRDDLFSRL